MKMILLFLTISFSLFSQTYLNEQFNDFSLNTSNADMIAYYRLDANDAGYLDDIKSSKFSFTNTGSMVNGYASPFVSGDSGLSLNGSSQYLNGGSLGENFYTLILRIYTPLINSGSSFQAMTNFVGFTNRGIWTGSSTGLLTDEILAVFGSASGDRFGWTDNSASIEAGAHEIHLTWDGSKYNFFIDGESVTMEHEGVNALISPDNFDFGLIGIFYYTGGVFEIAFYDAAQDQDIGFVANGWTFIDGDDNNGATRLSQAFHQGVTADTVYYSTALTTGNWSISANVDGASGGESVKVLTSADGSTWSALGTITATTTATDYTVTGTGLGYIGFGLSSGTVYLDNVSVSANSSGSSDDWQHPFAPWVDPWRKR